MNGLAVFQPVVSLDGSENVQCGISVKWLQMKFEARRKAEQEKRRREMVLDSSVLLTFEGQLCAKLPSFADN